MVGWWQTGGHDIGDNDGDDYDDDDKFWCWNNKKCIALLTDWIQMYKQLDLSEETGCKCG